MIYRLNDLDIVLWTTVCSILFLTFSFVAINQKRMAVFMNYYTSDLDCLGHVFLIQTMGVLLLYIPIKTIFEIDGFNYNSPLQFLNYCILLPMIIEFIVCGLVLRFVSLYMNKLVAIVGSALLISMLQEQGMLIIVFWVISLSTCMVFYNNHSLIFVMFMHSMTNLVIFLLNNLSLLGATIPLNNEILFIIFTIGMLLYIYSVYLIGKRNIHSIFRIIHRSRKRS